MKIDILGQNYAYSIDSSVVAHADHQATWTQSFTDDRFLGIEGHVTSSSSHRGIFAKADLNYKLGLQSNLQFSGGEINANIPMMRM